MLLTIGDTADSFLQFLTVSLLFIGVLAATYYVSRWVAGYQKQHRSGANIELIESFQLSQNKLVQILRLGDSYVAVAVCKDSVTVLKEIPKEQLKTEVETAGKANFRDLLFKSVQTNTTEISDDRMEEK